MVRLPRAERMADFGGANCHPECPEVGLVVDVAGRQSYTDVSTGSSSR